MKILLAIILFTGSCSQVSQPVKDITEKTEESKSIEMKQETKGKEVEFEILVQGPISEVNEAQIRVVKGQEGLNEIYNYLNKSRKPALNMPQVDFEKETIIATHISGRKFEIYINNQTKYFVKVYYKKI